MYEILDFDYEYYGLIRNTILEFIRETIKSYGYITIGDVKDFIGKIADVKIKTSFEDYKLGYVGPIAPTLNIKYNRHGITINFNKLFKEEPEEVQ